MDTFSLLTQAFATPGKKKADPRVGSGGFQNLTGRVGWSEECIKMSRIVNESPTAVADLFW